MRKRKEKKTLPEKLSKAKRKYWRKQKGEIYEKIGGKNFFA